MQSMKIQKTKKGMTLIEILVVLAILAAVGAMLARGIGAQRTAAMKKQAQLEATRIVDLIRVKMIEDEKLTLQAAVTAIQTDLNRFNVKTEITNSDTLTLKKGAEVVGIITEKEIRDGTKDVIPN